MQSNYPGTEPVIWATMATASAKPSPSARKPMVWPMPQDAERQATSESIARARAISASRLADVPWSLYLYWCARSQRGIARPVAAKLLARAPAGVIDRLALPRDAAPKRLFIELPRPRPMADSLPPLLQARGFCDAFDLSLPILMAPMAGACHASLAIAVANAGGLVAVARCS